LIGMFGVAASLEGYLFRNMRWYERVLSAAGGLLLIYPGLVTDVIGFVLVALVVALQFIGRKNNTAAVA